MNELEGDFGTGGKAEWVEGFRVGGVHDPVEPGTEERGGGAQGCFEGDTVGCSAPWRMMLRVR
ncbi:hypothetical protein PV379_05345 [Streptomyces caniscabiei]|uniref:hypothetical protein n=1 Tax=Streptomyces caniscabiei TaxID=2746961 RepID=UPI0029BDDBA2|nr:hypothetical protein [Streptomyces caniscabiei]MDX2599646.1 hypothetical protein [Streptomyces caniscabiei]MDX2735059.1 hypothetical protein [Streptomyces caniscabiei]MDX2776755.1 hypothetical protein [Streptomyces caniscabiei]